MSTISKQGLSDRQHTQMRMERLVALLAQANEALIQMGSYIPNTDPNRVVLEEVIKTNHVVVQEESEALRRDEAKYSPIIL